MFQYMVVLEGMVAVGFIKTHRKPTKSGDVIEVPIPLKYETDPCHIKTVPLCWVKVSSLRSWQKEPVREWALKVADDFERDLYEIPPPAFMSLAEWFNSERSKIEGKA